MLAQRGANTGGIGRALGYFQELYTDLLDATGAKKVVNMVDALSVAFEITRLVSLSLIVT